MKRLAIWGVVVFLGLLFAPAGVIGGPAGPTEGLDVKIVNPLPLPVTGDVNAVQAGEWKVNINNSSTDPVNVCDVCEDPCIKEPVLIQRSRVAGPGTPGARLEIYEVENDDEFFVIETVSISVVTHRDSEIGTATLDTPNGFLLYLPVNCGGPLGVTRVCGSTVMTKIAVQDNIDAVFNHRLPGPLSIAWEYRATIAGYIIEKQCPHPLSIQGLTLM